MSITGSQYALIIASLLLPVLIAACGTGILQYLKKEKRVQDAFCMYSHI